MKIFRLSMKFGFDRDVIKSASPVFVYFCDGSEPCSRMWPTVESVANKVFDKYRVVRVDVAAHPTIAQDYYVAATPAYAIFKDGKRYKQLAGVIPEEYLMNFLGGSAHGLCGGSRQPKYVLKRRRDNIEIFS